MPDPSFLQDEALRHVAVSQLKLHPQYDCQRHSKEARALQLNSGAVQPLFLQPDSNTVVVGNLLLDALLLAGIGTWPVLTLTPNTVCLMLTQLGRILPGDLTWEANYGLPFLKDLLLTGATGEYTLFDAPVDPGLASPDPTAEPRFTLRAQDRLAPLTLALYIVQLEDLYSDAKKKPPIIASARALRAQFLSWQAANPHRLKNPD